MTHAHATRRAQILARFGRFREAVETLEAAVAQDPANEELRLELASMKQRSVEESQGAGRHMAVGCLLFLGSLGATCGPVLWALHVLKPYLDKTSIYETSSLLLLGALFFGLIFLAIMLADRMFLWCWFTYLTILPSGSRTFAEECLARILALHLFEPRYSRIRESRLGPDA